MPHRVAADSLRTDRVRTHLAPSRDQRHEARHLAALDVTCHRLVGAVEPRPGPSSGAQRLLLSFVSLQRLNTELRCRVPTPAHTPQRYYQCLMYVGL